MPNKLLPLSLDETCFPESKIVALETNGQTVCGEQFQQRLSFWHIKTEVLKRDFVAVFHSNTLDFLCIILNLWDMGKVPVIPSNRLNSTLEEMAIITDEFIGEISYDMVAERGVLGRMGEPSIDTALILFTSGSSGAPKPITKTFSQLNAELNILESHWGEGTATVVVGGSVSHHHMYGLPFRLLWPLVSGRAFFVQEFVYWEQLERVVDRQIVFITSPVHLENLPENIPWALLRKSIVRVFSAGSKLSAEVANMACDKIGLSVTEIYGSTETGAVATRQCPDTGSWTPLNGVEVMSDNGRLLLRSPSVNPSTWFATEDTCEIDASGCFTLGHRVDSLVKVGGKRVSLTHIEAQILRHPWVEDVKVTLLNKRKSRIGALVKLTGEGSVQLVDKGNRALNQELLHRLQGSVEPVAWPRYWRYVSRMPLNTEGKISRTEIERQFNHSELLKFPMVLAQTFDDSGTAFEIEMQIPQELYYFEGHFPGRPVLPGVVQISWAIHYAGEQFKNMGVFKALEVVKFQRILQPHDVVVLRLQWDELKRRILFSYSRGDITFSSGRIAFRNA